MLNPNFTLFPESSLIDHSGELDAPAGKHGFVTSKNGHFYFADGKRVRFYGINLAKQTVFLEKPQIDRLVALFARAGINMVRIHHIDDVQGIITPENPEVLNVKRMDALDYWVAKLKERGIYLCLDLNDYRTFHASEGVTDGESLGRGAKPYAVFDQRLITLQQKYARQFLVEHVNPYTGLAYASDPAIALLEIYDENGLFIRRGDLPTLRQPYRAALQQSWNAWLRYRYPDTTALRAAWTDRSGACALTSAESLEMATVQLPAWDLKTSLPQNWTNPLAAPARVSDGIQFAYAMQKNYLQTMHNYLREIGVKIPITAVGAQEILPDLMATAETTDYIGINYYWDHPQWNAGQEWSMPSYFSLLNPFKDNIDYSFPVIASVSRMHGKPLVVRELGYCFPNPYRGAGMLESAAYGAFLDVDALIVFTYDAFAGARSLGYFDIHLDPLRWGTIAQAARLFLSGEVETGKLSVGLGYSDVDAFTWTKYSSPLYYLSFAVRVENYTDTGMQHPFDLLVASGRSGGGQWPGKRLLLFANQLHTDLHFQGRTPGLDERHGYHLETQAEGVSKFTFYGIGYDNGTVKELQAAPPYSLEALRTRGLTPVAAADPVAYGFIDTARDVIGFRNLRYDLAVRVTLDALRDWNKAMISHSDLDQGRWHTDTGQIDRNVVAGVLRIDTPSIQVLAGDLDGGPLYTSALRLSTSTPVGTLTVESLDGQPLATSTNYLATMTTKARNDLMSFATTNDGPKPHRLSAAGSAPILTDGKAASAPTSVSLGSKPLIELSLQNGTWSYLVNGNRALLYLDTGNITVKLPARPKLVRWHTAEDIIEHVPNGPVFTVPEGVRYTEISW